METVMNNSGLVTDNIALSGDAQFAAGDINNEYNIENNNYNDRSGFASINPSAYGSEFYTSPVFTGALAERAKDRRLIVIAGGQGFDKGAFIRHLSCRIIEDAPGMVVKEWRDSEGEDRIRKEIEEAEKPCVFILTEAVPKHVNYDLAKLTSIVKQHGHIMLITTEMTLDTWQLHELVSRLYWYEVPLKDLYDKKAIAEIFYKRAESNKKLLGLEPDEEVKPHLELTNKYSLEKIASSFETPDQVEFFMTLIEADTDPELESKISTALATVTDKTETLVTKWYRTLSPGEKLIALGAALLDGLFDDQFFAVMQKVVENFWHYREQDLRSLDYCDLEFLFNFFKLEDYDDGRQVLVCRFPNQRAEIIRAAWSGHKRHILSAFTVLTQLAGRSSAKRRVSEEFDISGTTERGMRLRVTAAGAISDVGIVSLKTAEPKLVELAVVGDETIRLVTAKAIARWREFGKDEQIFTTLESWTASKSNTLRSSVILTLRYAAEYDSPGHLDERIMNILASMAEDEKLRTGMEDLLTRLIRQHHLQIAEWLGKNFACRKHLREALCKSMLELYKEHPDRVKLIIDGWFSTYKNEGSKENRRQELTQRDNVIALILEIFRNLPYTGHNDTIDLSYVWSVIQALHGTEQRKTLRNFVLSTIAFMVGVQPDKALKYLEDIFTRVGTDERYIILEGIGEAYLQQRRALEDAPYSITVKGISYPAWQHSRPSTLIEKTLYAWLPGNDPFAREIATLSFMQFARILDYEERILVPQAVSEALEKERQDVIRAQQQAREKAASTAVVFPTMPELSWWTHVKIFFWLLFKSSEDKMVLRQVMNVLLKYRETNPAHLNIIISRWSNRSEERTRLIAWWVQKLKGF